MTATFNLPPGVRLEDLEPEEFWGAVEQQSGEADDRAYEKSVDEEMFPANDRIPVWRKWSKPDQKRYLKLDDLIRQQIRVPVEDYAWFIKRKKIMGFYQSIFRRHYIRNHGTAVVREQVYRGHGTI